MSSFTVLSKSFRLFNVSIEGYFSTLLMIRFADYTPSKLIIRIQWKKIDRTSLIYFDVHVYYREC